MVRKDREAQLANLEASCSSIPPGTVISVDDYSDDGDGVAFGDASFNGKDGSVGILTAMKVDKPLDETRAFKRVNPRDVRNAPSKWQDREIEFAGANVYWVSNDDVRIVTSALVTIFATRVGGADATYLADNCETEDEALSRKCRVTAKFVYHSYDEDNPTPVSKRTVLKSRDVILVREAQSQQRRRR